MIESYDFEFDKDYIYWNDKKEFMCVNNTKTKIDDFKILELVKKSKILIIKTNYGEYYLTGKSSDDFMLTPASQAQRWAELLNQEQLLKQLTEVR